MSGRYIVGPCYRCNAETICIAYLPAPIIGPIKPARVDGLQLSGQTWGYLCEACQRRGAK